MRGYNLPSTKQLWQEDVILKNIIEENYKEKIQKWRDVMEVEGAMKNADPSFKGFYSQVNYWDRFDKCIDKYDAI